MPSCLVKVIKLTPTTIDFPVEVFKLSADDGLELAQNVKSSLVSKPSIIDFHRRSAKGVCVDVESISVGDDL